MFKCTSRYGDSETPRSMYPERSGRNGGTLFGDQDFSRSLMEAFTDPARHARMMQASQAEYLLMVADNLGSDSNGDTAYVNLHGDLPYEIENKLKEGYGRFNQVGNSHVLLVLRGYEQIAFGQELPSSWKRNRSLFKEENVFSRVFPDCSSNYSP